MTLPIALKSGTGRHGGGGGGAPPEDVLAAACTRRGDLDLARDEARSSTYSNTAAACRAKVPLFAFGSHSRTGHLSTSSQEAWPGWLPSQC